MSFSSGHTKLYFTCFSNFIFRHFRCLDQSAVCIKAGVNLNLSEVKRFKEGIEEIKLFWNTTRHLISMQEHSRLSGDCFGVQLLIFNFKF